MNNDENRRKKMCDANDKWEFIAKGNMSCRHLPPHCTSTLNICGLESRQFSMNMWSEMMFNYLWDEIAYYIICKNTTWRRNKQKNELFNNERIMMTVSSFVLCNCRRSASPKKRVKRHNWKLIVNNLHTF